MLSSIGVWLNRSYFYKGSEAVFDLTGNYEQLLNASRSIKSLVETITNIPSPIPLMLNPVFSFTARVLHCREFHLEESTFAAFKPFARAVKSGRDFLNFFELPLRIKRVCEKQVWDPEKTLRTRLLSMLVQIPQKTIESFLIIPAAFNILDLGKLCNSWGGWCANKFGSKVVWEYIFFYNSSFNNTFWNLKEGFALLSSVLNIVSMHREMRERGAKLASKTQRMESIQALKTSVDSAVRDGASFESIALPLVQFKTSAPEGRKTLQQLEEDLHRTITMPGDAFLEATHRYLRRLVLETGGTMTCPDMVPAAVKFRIRSLCYLIPSPDIRLQKVIDYKYNKSVVQLHNLSIDVKKQRIAWWFEISKSLVIAIGLLFNVVQSTTLAGVIVRPLASKVLQITIKSVETALWGAGLFIGCTGAYRTYSNVYYPKRDELPNALEVFDVRP